MLQELLTVKELSAKIKIPVSTLRLYCRNNKIPFYEIGKHYRFKADEIEEWLEGHLVKQSAKEFICDPKIQTLQARAGIADIAGIAVC